MGNKEESATQASNLAPSLDRIFDLLSSTRRRQILYYLHNQSEGVATIDELVEYVVVQEPEQWADAHPHEREVETALHHVHLPKLIEYGVLEYDPRSQTVRYWSQPSLEEWLEHAYHKECRL